MRSRVRCDSRRRRGGVSENGLKKEKCKEMISKARDRYEEQ